MKNNPITQQEKIIADVPLDQRRLAIVGFCVSAAFILIPTAILIVQLVKNGFLLDMAIFSILLLFVLLYNLWTTIRWMKDTKIEVSKDGVVYKSTGIAIKSSWNNVASIQKRANQEYLLLKSPSAFYIGSLTAFLRATTTSYRDIDRRIPLHVFGLSINSTPLRQYLNEFAPWLIEYQL